MEHISNWPQAVATAAVAISAAWVAVTFIKRIL